MWNLSQFLKKLSPTKQFLISQSIYEWAVAVFDMFYMTYIFKESGDPREVVINMLVTFVMIYLAFVLGSWLMNKIGVELNLKLSYALYFITGIVGLLLAEKGYSSFLTISIIRGIAEGIFWSSTNFVELVGLPHESRSQFYSVSHSIQGIFDMVMPVILGVLIAQSQSLLPAYAIFGAFWLVGLLIPFDFKSNHQLSFSWKTVFGFLKRPMVIPYTTIRTIASWAWMLGWLSSSIIPFAVLGNEVDMGIFLAISSLISIVGSYLTRKVKVENKLRLGFWFLMVYIVGELLLVFNLNPLFLYVSGIMATLAGTIMTPAEFDLGVHLSGEFQKSKQAGTELNMYQESVFTLARLVLGGVILLIAPYMTTTVLLQGIIIATVLFRLFVYLYSSYLLKIKLF